MSEHIRSEYGRKFCASTVHELLDRLKAEPLFIEPGIPWENGYDVNKVADAAAALNARGSKAAAVTCAAATFGDDGRNTSFTQELDTQGGYPGRTHL